MHGIGQLIGFVLFVIPAMIWQWITDSDNSGEHNVERNIQ